MTYPSQQPGGWSDPSWPSQPQPGNPYDPNAQPMSGQPISGQPISGQPVSAGQAPYGGYGYPAYGVPVAAGPKTNGLAIASMVVSLVGAVGLCGYGLGGYIGIVGAILGHVARRQIRERGEGGDGMALAGVIVGWIATALAILATIALVIFFVWAAGQDPNTLGIAV